MHRWWESRLIGLLSGLILSILAFVCGWEFSRVRIIYYASHQISQLDDWKTGARLLEPETVATGSWECGITPEEARAKGCKFELDNFTWMPRACFDQGLNDEWRDANWALARDETGRDRIPTDEAENGTLPIAYIEFAQHKAHCWAKLRKFHRAVAAGSTMDNFTASYAHTRHCSKILMEERTDLIGFNSAVTLKYASCNRDWLTAYRTNTDSIEQRHESKPQ